MAGLGVSIAVIDDEGRILLEKREDFHVWGLPGGEIEAGESAAQAALREVREETGLEVRLTRLVGLYAMPSWTGFNNHSALFAAEPVGGTLTRKTSETVDAAFFSPDKLPEPLVAWHQQRIQDALAGVGGSVAVLQKMNFPFGDGVSRQELYRQRDESGLSRQQYFLTLMKSYPVRDVFEVEAGNGAG